MIKELQSVVLRLSVRYLPRVHTVSSHINGDLTNVTEKNCAALG